MRHTREPWPSRVGGWLRRNRRRLAVAAVVVLAVVAVLGATLGLLLERADDARLAQKRLEEAKASLDAGDYRTAQQQFDATSDLIDHFGKLDLWRYAPTLRNVPKAVGALATKLRKLHFGPDLDEIRAKARDKANIAKLFAESRDDADALSHAAERLRFRLLLGGGDELPETARELHRALDPFYVLKSPDWTEKQGYRLQLLDPPRLKRLRVEVNELLFLWIATIDEALSSSFGAGDPPPQLQHETAVARATALCDHALVFVEPKEPWRALRTWLGRTRSAAADRPAAPARQVAPDFEGEPHDVAVERSALVCFQWAVLCSRAKRPARAIEWMRQAVWLDPGNYWYQFCLAYVEDQAGSIDNALEHYSVAVALKPNSPWVRFSRARLYRSKGWWSRAIEDMAGAVTELRDQPEARRVHLELGYLYQELGDFAGARAEYARVTATNTIDGVARAARLNRANLDVESGASARARAEYDALLALKPGDTVVRHSRALLELRMGQAAQAEDDLSALLEMGFPLRDRNEILAARALARLLLGRTDGAIADASAARAAHPCPAHERLWQRALLAAGRFEDLGIDRPDAPARLPLGGVRLRADLRAAADGLAPRAAGRDRAAFRANLTRAVLLAALGEPDAAVAAASRALALSPFSSQAYLIRAHVLAFGGDRQGAWSDVEQGLAIHPEEPSLIDLRGVLRLAAGDPRGAIDDFNRAIARGALDPVHAHKASALAALGDSAAAIPEWSLALRRDPELPESFLGRARTHIQLGEWDLALADLEQAASWAHSDPQLELAIVAAYGCCLGQRPDRLPRLLTLAWRTAGDVARSLDGRARSRMAAD